MNEEYPANHYEPIGESVRIFQRGGAWHANFQYQGKQHRVSLQTSSKKQARRKALRLEAELQEGRYQDRPEPTSVIAVINDYTNYLRTERRAKKTLQKYEKVFERLHELSKRLCFSTINNLTIKVIDAYRHERVVAGAAPKTVYNESVIIRQVVNFALSRAMITTDPLKGLKIRESKPTPPAVLVAA